MLLVGYYVNFVALAEECSAMFGGRVLGLCCILFFSLHQTREMCGYCDPSSQAFVSLSVARLSCANAAERIEILFEIDTLGVPRNIVLDIDVKTFFTFFLFWSRFLTFLFFQTFFYFKKNVGKVQSG